MTGWVRRALAAIVVLAATAAAALAWERSQPACDDARRDLDGRCVVLDEPPAPAAALRATGGRFQAPRYGLDVPLVELSAVGGVINPPTLTDAFLVLDDGSSDDGGRPPFDGGHPSPDDVRPVGDGTGPVLEGVRPVLVAMHAVRDGRAPGNAFVDASARILVRAGDLLIVDGVEYNVTEATVLPKEVTAVSPDIWAPRPDGESSLVVITCLQRPGGTGAAAENLVIHARHV